MKIFMTGTSFDWMDEVWFTVLKNGSVAIKYSLDSEFTIFMSKSQFKHLVAEAKKREQALKEVTFVLEPERAAPSE